MTLIHGTHLVRDLVRQRVQREFGQRVDSRDFQHGAWPPVLHLGHERQPGRQVDWECAVGVVPRYVSTLTFTPATPPDILTGYPTTNENESPPGPQLSSFNSSIAASRFSDGCSRSRSWLYRAPGNRMSRPVPPLRTHWLSAAAKTRERKRWSTNSRCNSLTGRPHFLASVFSRSRTEARNAAADRLGRLIRPHLRVAVCGPRESVAQSLR